VRKSSNQLDREVFSPSRSSLMTSCCGMIVLNAELKSMNSIKDVGVLVFQLCKGWVEPLFFLH